MLIFGRMLSISDYFLLIEMLRLCHARTVDSREETNPNSVVWKSVKITGAGAAVKQTLHRLHDLVLRGADFQIAWVVEGYRREAGRNGRGRAGYLLFQLPGPWFCIWCVANHH